MRDYIRLSVREFLGYLFAIVALGWVLSSVDWLRVLRLVGDISPWVITAVLIVSLLGIVPRVWMWSVLLQHFQPVDFTDVLRADLVVKFVNTLFPSRFSGRSIAPAALRHFTGISFADGTAVTGAHTGLYAIWYAVGGMVGLIFLLPRLNTGILVVVTLSILTYIGLAGLVLIGGWHLDKLQSLLHRLVKILLYIPVFGERFMELGSSATRIIVESSTGFRAVLGDRSAVATYGVAWTLALMIFPAVRVYLLFLGFGVDIHSAWLLPFYLVAAYAITILPLTPGGIGVAEATSTVVFVSLGYPLAVVVPVIVLDRLLGFYLPAVVGWYPMITVDFSEILARSD